MTGTRPRDGRTGQPSNRLSHGLRSRLLRTSREDDADALAAEILAGCPRDAEISSLARDMADAILHLSAIRVARRHLFAPPHSRDHREAQPDEDGAGRGTRPVSDVFRDGGQALRVIDDYERKAISRRNGLIRRLDYLTLEIMRRTTR